MNVDVQEIRRLGPFNHFITLKWVSNAEGFHFPHPSPLNESYEQLFAHIFMSIRQINPTTRHFYEGQ